MTHTKLIRAILVCMIAFWSVSCYEDKGNYDYRWVDDIQIELAVADTTIERGGVLEMEFSILKNIWNEKRDSVVRQEAVEAYDRFSYAWYAIPAGSNSRSLLSKKQNLDEAIFLPIKTDKHRLELWVTDQTTGVTSFAYCSLRVTGSYLNTFLFLTEDAARNVDLELYATRASGEQVLEKGVLERAGFPYTTGGAHDVMYQKYSLAYGPERIWIATGSGVSWIDPLNYSWDPVSGDISTLMALPVRTFERIFRVGMIRKSVAASNYMFFQDGGIYILINDGKIRQDIGYISNQKIQIAPMQAGSNDANLLWDETNKQFVGINVNSGGNAVVSTSCVPQSDRGAEAKGSDCIFLGTSTTSSKKMIGIVKDQDNRYWKYEFRATSKDFPIPWNYFPEFSNKIELNGTAALGRIDHWVVSIVRGDIYGSVGNKLYAYREYEQDVTMGKWQEVSIKDKDGTPLNIQFDPISFLYAESFGAPYDKCFYVATYSEANGGIIYAFDPDPSGESTQLTLIEKIEGLGNVKSIGYWGY